MLRSLGLSGSTGKGGGSERGLMRTYADGGGRVGTTPIDDGFLSVLAALGYLVR